MSPFGVVLLSKSKPAPSPPYQPPFSAKASSSMPLDPAIQKEISAWLHKSQEDLRAAAVDLKAEPTLFFIANKPAKKSSKLFFAECRPHFAKRMISMSWDLWL
jgi:hypothetical protein